MSKVNNKDTSVIVNFEHVLADWVEISAADLDWTHRIRKKKAGQNKPRPIIGKLSRYNVRKKIFSNKKIWKDLM